MATAHEPGAPGVTLLWTFTPTINYSGMAYNLKAAAAAVSIAPPAGSQPHTGRAPLMNFTIGMPNVQ